MEDLNFDELDKLGFPLVVKPNSGGSSVGVKIVYDERINFNAGNCVRMGF